MITADWIFLGILLVSLILGAILGFGKILKFILNGKIIGTLISVVLCYLFGGLILGIPAVQDLLRDLAAHWAGNKFLEIIHLEIIIYYVGLFVVVTLIRILLVAVIKGITEAKVLPMKIFNSVGGAILLTAFILLLTLFAFQCIALIGGETAQNFVSLLDGSGILKPMYEHNPMAALITLVQQAPQPE